MHPPPDTNGPNSRRVVAPGASRRPPRLVGGWTPTREGADDDRDHPARAGRGRAAARGGAVPGREGGAADARPGAGAGGGLARGSGAGGRHGPADLARLGAPPRRRGPPRPARPASTGTLAPTLLRRLADRLNDTPRRCLGYRTPREVFRQHLAAPTGPP